MIDHNVKSYFIVGDLYKTKMDATAFFIGEDNKSYENDILVPDGQIITCVSSERIIEFVWNSLLIRRHSDTMQVNWFEKLEEK